MVEWWMELMMMMMMVSRPKSNLPYLTQREYLVRTTTNQPIRSFIAKVYVLGTFRTKNASDYRQGYSIPSYHVSDDDDGDALDWQGKAMMMMMMMVMITSIGKARQNNHFCHEQRHAKISCVKRGQDRVVGSLSLLGGLWNIVSLEVKEMVWGKRRLLDCCLCSVALKMEGEERKGKERKGEERKASKHASRQVSRYLCISGVQLTQGTTF